MTKWIWIAIAAAVGYVLYMRRAAPPVAANTGLSSVRLENISSAPQQLPRSGGGGSSIWGAIKGAVKDVGSHALSAGTAAAKEAVNKKLGGAIPGGMGAG